mgnify:CR=1 FL=1
MEKELSNLFEDVIKLWKIAEETVINDRGTLDDYDLLEKSIEKISKVLYNIDNENTPSVCSRYHL